MARGGERLGRPGQAYANRTDLTANPQKTTPAPPPRPQDPSASPFAGLNLTPLDAPTNRPDEPVTAGAPVGPGPGPEAIGLGPETELDDLHQLYAIAPSEGLRRLIERYERL